MPFESKQLRFIGGEDAQELNQQRQSEKMEALGRLATGIAHDFNNLLLATLGNAELLSRALKGNANAVLQGYADGIVKAAIRGRVLTTQLLAFSRQQGFQPEILDLNAALGEMKGIVQRLVGEEIETQFQLGSNVPNVRIDPGHLQQVLFNLTANAHDAMPRAGKLTVATAKVMIDGTFTTRYPEAVPGQYAMLAVIDTGTGMDSVTKAHIFEPFFTTKSFGGAGTGLGLSTVYGVIKQNGGFITVESEPGTGAIFRIYLPGVRAAQSRTIDRPLETKPCRGSETVLVVDDEGTVLYVVRECLRQNGYHMLTARRPCDALAIAENHPGPIHLLLTDIVMPGIDGPGLAMRLSVLRPGLKVIYMSGYPEQVCQQRIYSNSGTVILEKPFMSDALLRVIREALAAT